MVLEKSPAPSVFWGAFSVHFICIHSKASKSSPLEHPFYIPLMATTSFVQLRRGHHKTSGSVYHT